MNPIFLLNAPPVVGEYLPGQYAWPTAQRLTTARVRRPAGAGALTLTLEVGGVPGAAFALPAAGAAGEQTLALDRAVPAGAAVRWRITAYAPGTETTGLALVLDDLVAPAPAVALTVRWVNGRERWDVFTYDPETRTFTETSPGWAAGRAACIVDGAGFTITLAGTPALHGAVDGTLHTTLHAGSGSGSDLPRLEFLVAGAPIARLTPAGLTVPAATQAIPADLPDQFWLGGAALTARGVVAERFAPL